MSLKSTTGALRLWLTILISLATGLAAMPARAELFMLEYSHLTAVKKKQLCVSGIHRIDPKIGNEPTNGRGALSCRLRIGVSLKAKQPAGAIEKTPQTVLRQTYALGKVTEVCADFSLLLEPDEEILEIASLVASCMPAEDLGRYREKIGIDGLSRAEVVKILQDKTRARHAGLPVLRAF